MTAYLVSILAFIVIAIFIIAFSVFYESVWMNWPKTRKDPNEDEKTVDNVNI